MIYIDRFYHRGKLCGHLFTDSSFEELHLFAASIGLHREWFQGDKKVPHYDIIGEQTRVRAIKAGAIPCGRKQVLIKGLRQTIEREE